MKIAELYTEITAKDSGFKAAMSRTKAAAIKVQRSLESVSRTAQRMLLAEAAALGFFVKMASDSEETANKFKVVFKGMESAADDLAKNLAKNYGVSSKESQQFLADTGDMLTGFGLSRKGALRMSDAVAKLGVDLASFTNVEGGAKMAVDALTRGLLGEREMMKSLGIAIGEEDVKLQLLANGTNKLKGAALRAAKAQATLELAIKQSGNAIGDFDRSSDGLANQWRILMSNLKDLGSELGYAFVPMVKEAITWLVSVIKPIIDWAKVNKELVATVGILTIGVTTLVAALAPLALAAVSIIGLAGAMATAFTAVGAPIALVVAGLGLLAAALITTTVGWDDVKSAIDKASSSLKGFFTLAKLYKAGASGILDTVLGKIGGAVFGGGKKGDASGGDGSKKVSVNTVGMTDGMIKENKILLDKLVSDNQVARAKIDEEYRLGFLTFEELSERKKALLKSEFDQKALIAGLEKVLADESGKELNILKAKVGIQKLTNDNKLNEIKLEKELMDVQKKKNEEQKKATASSIQDKIKANEEEQKSIREKIAAGSKTVAARIISVSDIGKKIQAAVSSRGISEEVKLLKKQLAELELTNGNFVKLLEKEPESVTI